MSEHQRPLKVFLSYASQDKAVVREFSRRLVDEGWIAPWLDEKNLLPGQDWRTKIEEAVETSDIVVICLSSNSITKEGFVQKELRYAREIAFEKPDGTIFLIPLRLDDCLVPRGLRFYQWGDYFGEKKEDTYVALLEVFKIRHDQKLILEDEKRSHQEKERLEREANEKLAREKAEQETAEKPWIDIEEQEMQKTAKEKAERETADKIAREKAAREKEKREKKERETAEKVERENAKRETTDKPKPKAAKPKYVEEKPARKSSEVKPKAAETQSSHRKPNNQVTFWMIGLVVIIFVISMLYFNNKNRPQIFVPTSAQTSLSETKTPLVTPIQTAAPNFTPTADSMPNPTTPAVSLNQIATISLVDYAQGAVDDFWVSPDGSILAISSDKDIQVVSLDQKKVLWSASFAECNYFERMAAFSPDGSIFAVGGCGIWADLNHATRIWLFDTQTGTVKRTITWDASLYQLAFSPDGNYLFTISYEQGSQYGYSRLRIWKPATGEVVLTKVSGKNYMKSLDISNDGKYIAVANDMDISQYADPNLRIWSFGSPSFTPYKTISNQQSSVYNVSFSPDGTILASLDSSGVSIWDVLSGDLIKNIKLTMASSSGNLDFIKNGEILVVADKIAVLLYDVNSREFVSSIPGNNFKIISSLNTLMILKNGVEISVWEWE